MYLCNYKDILGTPKKGFHTHYFGFAIFDLLGTIFLSFLFGNFEIKKSLKYFVILMLIAIFLHWLFCVKTKLNSFLMLN